MSKRTIALMGIVLLIGCIITINLINQPGVKDLKGGFEERAFIRNEQNDGPVVRIYIVTVQGEYWEQMIDYGNYMPHTKYGTTKVFFFNAEKYPLEIELTEPHFRDEFEQYCLGVYEKDGMSQVHLRKYPFR